MHNLRRKLPSANALFVFEAAARCGNFTKAAEELCVTQPAVSRMLARMEDYMGVQLFQRVRGRTLLTDNGQILFRKISDGLRGIEAAILEIEARSTGTETITLSVSTAFTTHWLMPRMSKLHKDFPSVDLRFQLVSGKISGPVEDVDLGMRFITGKEVDEFSTLVMPEILLPVCSPTYLGHRREKCDDTLINLADGELDWCNRFPSLRKKDARPANSLTFSDYAIVIQAALLSHGIALGWLNVVSHWMLSGALVPVEQEVSLTGRTCQLVCSARKPIRSVVSEVRDWIVEESRSDIAAIGKLYPSVQLEQAV